MATSTTAKQTPAQRAGASMGGRAAKASTTTTARSPTSRYPGIPHQARIGRLSRMLEVSSDPQRLRIVWALGTHDSQNIPQLAGGLGMDATACTSQVTELKKAGLIMVEKSGGETVVSLTGEGASFATFNSLILTG